MLTAEPWCVEEVDGVETNVDARVSLDFFDPLTFLVLDFMKAILMLLILILDEDSIGQWRHPSKQKGNETQKGVGVVQKSKQSATLER